MKRDFDLIRRILKDIENMPAGEICSDFTYPEYDQTVIYDHVDLLINAGFITGQILRTLGGIAGIHVTGLTWAGHDFLDASKDDSIWSKAKENVLKPGVSFSFDILLEWLKVKAKEKLGMP